MSAPPWLTWGVLVACTLFTCSAFTVDCNTEYTDCDTELGKYATEGYDYYSTEDTTMAAHNTESSTIFLPTIPPPKNQEIAKKNDTDAVKPKGRLLNVNLEDLTSIHDLNKSKPRQETKTVMSDLSDVNLDDDDDDIGKGFKLGNVPGNTVPDKFFSNLQAPFHPMNLGAKASDEIETCKENGVNYSVGDRLNRGCEETCICSPAGAFECSPRCKTPYMRRGRRIDDPLCFETPVDECCSILACATGVKPTNTKQVCRYGNDTYNVGTKWSVACERVCTCENDSVIICQPRCPALSTSDKCINVQDPNDPCCEVQVCDVSQDVHEEPTENSTTVKVDPIEKINNMIEMRGVPTSSMRPLMLAEPIGSVKVLQNNTVQVNLIHMNMSTDPVHLLLSDDGGKTYKNIQLKYDNLLLNLEGGKDYVLKTEETGTKFNFTITPLFEEQSTTEVLITTVKVGCQHEGKFYEVGEEFQIGCEELCECTGQDTQECAKLECPALVGIELLSKGCVRWAPAPIPTPPNCCPRTARCISDGTCHYKGHAIPNWSEVPISLTGCEQRCFCENGELDCQEICTPLPPVPPQNLRCLPGQRPAPVNISDDDCCKKWACTGGAGIDESQQPSTESMLTGLGYNNDYPTPLDFIKPSTTSVLVEPPTTTFVDIDSQVYLNPSKVSSQENIKESDSGQVYLDNVHSDIKHFYPSENLDSPLSVKLLPKNPHIDDDKLKSGKPHSVNKLNDYPYSHGYKNRPNSLRLNTNFKDSSPERFVFSNNNMYLAPRVDNAPNNNDNFVSHEVVPLLHHHDNDSPVKPSNIQKPKDYHTLHSVNKQSMSKKPQEPMHSLEEQYFKPTFINFTRNFVFPKPLTRQHLHSSQSNSREQYLDFPPKKIATVLYNKDSVISLSSNTTKYSQPYWGEKNLVKPSQFFSKETDPYDTMQLTAVLNDNDRPSYYHRPITFGQPKSFSTMDLENILNQLEVETEIGRNIGRSVESVRVKRPKAEIANPNEFEKPSKPPPSFLPTVPPDMYPHEGIADYNHNHIPLPVRPHEPLLPPGLPFVPNYGQHDNKFNVLSIQPESSTSIKMLFALPSYLVGLKGFVDLRYTDKKDNDVSKWHSQIFAPPDEILSTPRLEFRLAGLNSSTTYRVKGKLVIDNLPVQSESEIYTVRTLDAPIVEEKTRDISSKLTVADVNDTTAHITWRHFTEDELRFIDGIQIRYRPVGTPIYSMTELLHHSRSVAELKDLHPGSRYEASLVLIPPPRASTELHDPTRLEFKTAPYIDPYNWSVTVEARKVGSEAAELSWRGIPSPAERWVRVYRAAHECGSGRTKEHDTFRLASRDQPPTITLAGLEPNTRCRVWLELFLTNGKVKTSNVLEVFTKSADSPEPIDNVIEASSVSAGREGGTGGTRGDYYGALVVVGVVAALGALTSLLLLLIVVRRHRPHSVPITSVPSAPRESSLPPYDNPAYKLELQQETVDL